MTRRPLKRYPLENIAKILIYTGFLFVVFSCITGVYYFGITGKISLLIVPVIFLLILSALLLFIRYRYALFERYPYLMNLPSLFYRIGDRKGSKTQSIAFSRIFTVHALVICLLGIASFVLTIAMGSSIGTTVTSPLLYVYLAIVMTLAIAVILQYRRIYLEFLK